MMSGTSLSQQLQDLRSREHQAVVRKKRKVSLLFDSKTASDLDRKVIYEIGSEGITELELIDDRFKQFRETLFSQSAKGIDRYLLTKDREELIKREIKTFLQFLSPHLMHPASFKTLEWLIRRFSISEFDYEELIGCIIPFHDSGAFVQISGILQIPQKSRFYFVKTVQRTTMPLTREVIVKFISRDFSLLELILNLAEESRDMGICNNTLNSFVGIILVQYIESTPELSENHTRNLISILSKWQKKPETLQDLELLHISMMGLAALVNKLHIDKSVLFNLASVAIIALTEKTYDTTFDYITLISSPKPNSVVVPVQLSESCLDIILHKEPCDCIINKYKNNHDPTLISFVINATITHVSKFPNSLDKFRENIATLVSVVHGSQHPLVANLPNIINSLLDDVNSDALLEIMSILNRPNNLNNGTKILDGERLQVGNLNYILPSTVSVLLKSKNEHVLEGLLNRKDSLKSLIPNDTQLIDTLKDLILSTDISHKISNSFYEFILDISSDPNNIATATAIVDLICGKLWIKNFSLDRSQVLLSLNAIRKFDNLREFFGPLNASYKILMDSYDKIPLSFRLTCIRDLFNHVKKTKSLKLWIKLMDSPNVYCKLLALSVISLSIMEVTSDIDVEAIESIKNKLTTLFISNGIELCVDMFEKNIDEIITYTCQIDEFGINKAMSAFGTFTYKLLLDKLCGMIRENDGTCSCLNNISISDNSKKLLDIFKSLLAILSPYYNHLNLLKYLPTDEAQNIEFLVSFYIETFGSNCEYSTKILCLCISCIKLSITNTSKYYDYQLLIPILLSALTSEDRSLRVLSLDTLQLISRIYKRLQEKFKIPDAHNIYSYDRLYGHRTKEVLYITYDASSKFIHSILSHKGDILANAHAIVDLLDIPHHGIPEKIYKNEIIPFLCSTTLSIPPYEIKAELINALSKIDSTKKTRMFLDHIQKFIRTLHDPKSLKNDFHVTENLLKSLSSVFSGLVKIFHSHHTVSILNSQDIKYMNIWIETIKFKPLKIGEWVLDTQCISVKNITADVFNRLNVANKQFLLDTLITIASPQNGNTSESVYKAKKIINTLPIDENLVLVQLKILLKNISVGGNRCKKLKPQDGTALLADQVENGESGHRKFDVLNSSIFTFLEFLLFKKDVICGKLRLSGPLSDLLSFAVNLNQSDSVSVEYFKQLILSVFIHVVGGIKEIDDKLNKTHNIRVDVIVEFIRKTNNLKTQNSALLLLSTVAKVCPQEVLLNIMPVFIFIGSNIIRKDDNYNFYVIHKTLETVLPALVSSNNSEAGASSCTMSKVSLCINVIVGALLHIPKHRRLRLFTKLVHTLGEDKNLSLVIAHFIRLALVNKNAQQCDEILDFSKSLFLLFPLNICLIALLEIANITRNIPDEISNYDELSSVISMEMVHILFRGSIKHISKVRLALSNFVLSILSSTEFADKFLSAGISENIYIERQIDIIKVLIDSKYKFSSNKNNKLLVKTLRNSLYKITSLQTLPFFVQSSFILLDKKFIEDEIIDKKDSSALDFILNRYLCLLSIMKSKLPHLLEHGTVTSKNINDISEIIGKALDLGIKPDSILHCEKAQILLHELIYALAFTNSPRIPDILIGVSQRILSETWMLSEELFISGISCMSSLFIKLPGDCVSCLPSIMEMIEERFSFENVSDKHDVNNTGVRKINMASSIINLFSIILKALPELIPPFLLKMLGLCFDLTSYLNSGLYAGDDENVVEAHQCVDVFLADIVKSIKLPVLLQNVYALFDKTISMDINTLALYLNFVDRIITDETCNDKILEQYNDIFKLLLACSDYRGVYLLERTIEEINTIESKICNVFVNLFKHVNVEKIVYLFNNVFKWANTQCSKSRGSNNANSLNDTNNLNAVQRIVFLYNLSSNLTSSQIDFEQCSLKMIEYSSDTLLKILNVTNNEGYNTIKDSQGLTLLPPTLKFIHVFFQSDYGIKISHETLMSIMEILINLLSIDRAVSECLNASHKAIEKYNIVGEYIKLILAKTRNPDAEIRLSATLLLDRSFETINKNLSPYVPECVSFISELLEDDDQRIEKACQSLIRKIESSTNLSVGNLM